MSSLTEIEQAVQQLGAAELARFREWFAAFDVAQWDKQIERDLTIGRLDALAEEALNDLREGHCKEM